MSRLTLTQNRLTYPRGRPSGIDPSHPATLTGLGGLILSVVAIPGNFANLATGALGTSSGAGLVSGFDGIVGPVNTFANGTNLITFGVPPLPAVSCASVTTGVIVRIGSSFTGVNQYTINTFNAAIAGYGISTLNGDFNQLDGNSTILLASGALAVGVPYFLATSQLLGTGINWVMVNLLTGALTSGNTPTPGVVVTDVALYIGNRDDVSRPFAGSIAAGMLAISSINKQLSIPQLSAWAQDPWAFWYPNPKFNLVGTIAAGDTFTNQILRFM